MSKQNTNFNIEEKQPQFSDCGCFFDSDVCISYIYDATGVKQEKIVHNSSLSSVQNTYYAGNYIYTKGSAQSSTKLTFFHTEEGYVEPVFEMTGGGSLGGGLLGNLPVVERLVGFDYVYQYKDHFEDRALKKGMVYLFSE